MAKYDLTTFGLKDVVECSAAMRLFGDGAATMEAVAQKVVDYLYENVWDSSAHRGACALVRFFKTHPFEELGPDERSFAARMLGAQAPAPSMKCLTLLATRGDEKDWNSRRLSRGHLAIPLPSETMVKNAPMIAQLIGQLGLDIGTVLESHPEMIMDLEQKTFNVFHVGTAAGSPFIPAQEEFVRPFGIASVLGFGGLLPTGNLFAVILFSRTPIPRETANLFATISLAVKLAILPFEGAAVFQPH